MLLGSNLIELGRKFSSYEIRFTSEVKPNIEGYIVYSDLYISCIDHNNKIVWLAGK